MLKYKDINANFLLKYKDINAGFLLKYKDFSILVAGPHSSKVQQLHKVDTKNDY